LLIIAAPIIAFVCWRVGLSHKIEARIKAIKAAGYPTNPIELDAWYPRVPSEDNAALLFQSASSAQAAPGKIPPGKDVALPDYAKFKLPARGEAASDDLRATIDLTLEVNQTALDLLHQATKRKQSRYPVNLTQGFNSLVPHLTGLKQSALLLELEALSRIDSGQTQAAVESVEASFALAQSLSDEPILISQMLRRSVHQIAFRSMERTLNRTSLTDQQMAGLSDALGGDEGTNGFTRGLAGERAMGLGVFPGTGRFDSLANWRSSSTNEQIVFRLLQPLLKATGFFERDQIFCLDRIKELIHTTTLVNPGAAQMAETFDARQMEAKTGYYVFSSMLLPAMSKSLTRLAEDIACRKTALTALAIERYRLTHGNGLPDSINALTPAFLKFSPADPFDGKPLRFKRLARGYVVYSIGSDGTDDGGVERKEIKKSTDRLLPFDITFTVER